MRADSYFDAAVAAFIVIPVVLLAVLMAGVRVAWLRSGAAPAVAIQRALVVGAGALRG